MRPATIIPLIIILIVIGCKPSTDDQLTNDRVFYSHDHFSMGADLSYVNQILDKGGIYRDSGNIMDPYAIFSKYGANTIRFRLWHNPEWTRTVYDPPLTTMYNDLYDVKRGILEARALGMAVCLDFHYSDSWADPGKQIPPAAWNGLSLSVLRDNIYNYTLITLDRLEAAGAMPEYVQTGNEINPGFVLPKGNRWDNTADFIYNNYMHALTAEVAEGGGKGIFSWEPAWITSPAKDLWGTGSSWDCNTFFDFSGSTLKVMQFMSDSYEIIK